jgi:murein DD-endopeptidase MepM/ murein hydrolase activator NlpD
MRASAKTEKEGGLGGETYMSLFDMELARLFAERGLGLQEQLLKALTKNMAKTAAQADGSAPEGVPEAGRIPAHLPKAGDTRLSLPPMHKRQGQELTGMKLKADFGADENPSLPVGGVVSSGYGIRRHPVHGVGRFHHGVDLAAPAGTEIHPVWKGKVVFSGEQPGYGNVVIVDHGSGVESKYAHNMVNLVKKGDEVDTDTVIAKVGSTGLSTGPHLHFEVRYHGEAMDPLKAMASL